MRDLSRIRVAGPLEPYVSGFVAALVERGYMPVSTAHQLRLMAHVSRWLAFERVGYTLSATNSAIEQRVCRNVRAREHGRVISPCGGSRLPARLHRARGLVL
jgi:hypothetical protein